MNKYTYYNTNANMYLWTIDYRDGNIESGAIPPLQTVESNMKKYMLYSRDIQTLL